MGDRYQSKLAFNVTPADRSSWVKRRIWAIALEVGGGGALFLAWAQYYLNQLPPYAREKLLSDIAKFFGQ